MTSSSMTKLLSAIAATAAITLCAPAYALDIDVKYGGMDGPAVKLPSGLKWQKVGVTSKHKHGINIGNIDAKRQEYLYALWAKEIAENDKEARRICKGEPHCAFPVNMLFTEFSLNGITHRFSSASMHAYSGCELTGMSNSAVECDWRYEGVDEKTGKTLHSKTFRMCANTPSIGRRDENDLSDLVEFAVDKEKSAVYFTVNKIKTTRDGTPDDLNELCATRILIRP